MLRAIAILAVPLLLTSCISYQSDHDPGIDRVASIKTGHTTTDWLRTHLGTPLSRRETDRGSEIWHYQFDQREKTRVSLFLLINVKTDNSASRNFFFEVEDGVITDYWQD